MAEISQFSAAQLLELYAMVLLLCDEADRELLRRLGLDPASLAARLQRPPAWGLAASEDSVEPADPVADAARLIKLSGHTGNRRIVALLLRGALVDQLSMVQKASELRDLATATGRLPEWIFEPVSLTPVGAEILAPSASRDTAQTAISGAAERLPAEEASPGSGQSVPVPAGPYPEYCTSRHGVGEPDADDPEHLLREPDDDDFERYLRESDGGDGIIRGIDTPAIRDGPAHFDTG